jgi:putative DNA primase/helicase
MAGELATSLGIVPWGQGGADQAAHICFTSWIAARSGIEAAETTAGIAQVREFLSLHGSSRFEDAWNTPKDFDGTPLPSAARIANQAGWRNCDG